ncbi:hypothetical protein T439DRAFT_22136 [Meredithblackwellia eburnea MCA 4105]
MSLRKEPYFLGSCITMPLKLSVIPHLDALTPEARAIGSVNTTFWREDDFGKLLHVGTNVDTAGVINPLLAAFTGQASPFSAGTPHSFAPGVGSAVVIGGGGATRSSVYALHTLGLSPIYIVNRDPEETASIIRQFAQFDVRALESAEQAREELSKAETNGIRLLTGIGAIPSIEPVTEAEKQVYEIAKVVYNHSYNPAPSLPQHAGYLELPKRPVHVEMPYKPPMTLIRTIASQAGWETICGVECVLECCFEQAYAWTGHVVPLETREAARKVIRSRFES